MGCMTIRVKVQNVLDVFIKRNNFVIDDYALLLLESIKSMIKVEIGLNGLYDN